MANPPLRWIVAAAACTALAQACGSSSPEGTAEEQSIADGTHPPGPAANAPRTPGAPAAPEGVDGPPQVQLIGRFETTDPAGPKASWPGSRIVARFVGTSIAVTLREYADTWMDGAPSFWEVSIDRAPKAVLGMIPDDQPHVFELAVNLSPGAHEVELYKRSEMQTGITQFLGFDLRGGRALPPPPRQQRHIEAMADSYGTGYGVVGLNAPNLTCVPGPDHAGRWQDFKQAWPSVLGERFDAEVEGTVYSGKGLTRGKWATDVDGLIDYYDRANPNPAAQNTPALFDLRSWIPDVIVLAQGTVDSDLADFRTVYRDFVVNQLRARSPNGHIFLVVPGFVARQRLIDTVTSVARERAEAGDLKVHAVIPTVEEPEEMTGCGFHGSPAYHRRVANEIGAVISEKVGW